MKTQLGLAILGVMLTNQAIGGQVQGSYFGKDERGNSCSVQVKADMKSQSNLLVAVQMHGLNPVELKMAQDPQDSGSYLGKPQAAKSLQADLKLNVRDEAEDIVLQVGKMKMICASLQK